MTADKYVLEDFDGWTPSDPDVVEHMTFVARQDAIARHRGGRSYILPWSCPGCLRIVAEFEADHDLAQAHDLTPGHGRGALTTTGEGVASSPATGHAPDAPGEATSGSGPSPRERAPHTTTEVSA